MLKSDLQNGDKITSVWDNAILFSAFSSSLFILISSAETSFSQKMKEYLVSSCTITYVYMLIICFVFGLVSVLSSFFSKYLSLSSLSFPVFVPSCVIFFPFWDSGCQSREMLISFFPSLHWLPFTRITVDFVWHQAAVWQLWSRSSGPYRGDSATGWPSTTSVSCSMCWPTCSLWVFCMKTSKVRSSDLLLSLENVHVDITLCVKTSKVRLSYLLTVDWGSGWRCQRWDHLTYLSLGIVQPTTTVVRCLMCWPIGSLWVFYLKTSKVRSSDLLLSLEIVHGNIKGETIVSTCSLLGFLMKMSEVRSSDLT